MSVSLPFERIKHINDKYLHIVFGYIHNIQTKEIPESIKLVILLFYYSTLESSILRDNECDKLLSLFEQENVFKHLRNYSYKLLFRGTRDGFKTKTFYEKCNKKHTLCIIYTPQKNVFGGYTSIPWNRIDGSSTKYLSDPSAFIFKIRSEDEFNPKIFPVENNGKDAIGHDEDYFMTFCDHGEGFYCWQPEGSQMLTYATEYECLEYNLKEYELNGNVGPFTPLEIEVFQLE